MIYKPTDRQKSRHAELVLASNPRAHFGKIVLDYSPENELQSHASLRAISTLWRKSAASVDILYQRRKSTSRNNVKRGKFCFPFTVSCSLSPAFTLAEVLIVIGIIGMIADMTIPTLMNNVQDQVYKTSYVKAYSVASQAWTQAVGDNNIEYRASWTDVIPKIDNFKAFKSYFKVIKDCTSSNNAECWASGEKYYGCPSSDALAFTDASGATWSLDDNTSTTGADILIDTNGLKKPNKFGQDRFVLDPVTSDGIPETAGIPIKIIPIQDNLSYDASRCPSASTHPCYYKSWLMGK